MKKVLIALAALVLLAVGVFLYLARPVKPPSENLQDAGSNMPETAMNEEDNSAFAIFRIVQEESRAEFRAQEILRGEPFTAVGSTNAISGDILINTENPAASPLGTVWVNARTFQTDSPARDAAIARFILKAENDAYEFITFVPSSLEGMPQSISVDEPFTFRVTGALTIASVTREMTFDAAAELISDTRFVGEASGTVRRSDFGLTIPEVSFVASVDDEVRLHIELVASRIQ